MFAQAQKKRINQEQLQMGIDALLKEYRLSHKTDTREQINTLAQDIVSSCGVSISTNRIGPSAIFIVVGIALLLGTAGGIAWMKGWLHPTPQESDKKTQYATLPVVSSRLSSDTTFSRCELNSSLQNKLSLWLENAKKSYDENRLMTPPEDCLNLWTQKIIEVVQGECPGYSVRKHKLAYEAYRLRLKARDWYIRRGQNEIGKKRIHSACKVWLPRAAAFSKGELLEDLMQRHCSKKK